MYLTFGVDVRIALPEGATEHELLRQERTISTVRGARTGEYDSVARVLRALLIDPHFVRLAIQRTLYVLCMLSSALRPTDPSMSFQCASLLSILSSTRLKSGVEEDCP